MKRGKLGMNYDENKREDLDIGAPIFLNRKVLLVQISKEEIINNKKNKKQGFNNLFFDEDETLFLNKNNTEFIFDKIKKQKRDGVRKNEKKQKNMNEGIAEDLYEDIDFIKLDPINPRPPVTKYFIIIYIILYTVKHESNKCVSF